MGKRLDHRVEPPCIKLCRVPPSLPQPAIFRLPRRLLLGNLGELKCRPFFIFICKRRNENIINLNWLNVFCFQIRCHNRQDQDFDSQDFNRAYLQYCKCCTFYFVIQLLSEPGKKKLVVLVQRLFMLVQDNNYLLSQQIFSLVIV